MILELRANHVRAMRRISMECRPESIDRIPALIVTLRLYTDAQCCFTPVVEVVRLELERTRMPVACVPPASVPVSLRGSTEGVSAQGVVSQGGACLRGVYPGISAWWYLPHTPLHAQTDACENITLPQTSFAGGN